MVRRLDDRALSRHADVYGHDPTSRAIALMQGLASSDPWDRLHGGAALVLRPAPTPLLAVIGAVPDEERPLVDALGWQVDTLLARLRPVPQSEVERGCEALAAQLHGLLGEGVLAASSLIGVPRGGLIVAGLLAYALGIPADRIGVDPGPGGRLLLVDDCVLSGSRLGHWLATNPGPPVVAVQLASVPACREHLVAHHPRIIDCIAAIDLEDHAAGRDRAWHDRWRERAPHDLWTGDPDHVVFPWNEPDAAVWNPARARAERGWRVVPPAWCLKNRAAAGHATEAVQVNPRGDHGLHGPTDEVVWAEVDGAVVVAALGSPNAIRLTGVAAACWRQLVRHGDVATTTHNIAVAFGASPTVVYDDVARLVERLTTRGLLRSP
jgi:hypothetical protein